LLGSYDFPERTVFLIDASFYYEDDMALYREGGKHFVIPVPDSCIISKAVQMDLSFTGSFTYTKEDENGNIKKDRILYTESTVALLEEKYQQFLDDKTSRKNEEILNKAKEQGEKPKKIYERKVAKSIYGDDRIIMYRDEDMHDKMTAEFLEQLGSDDFHCEDNFKKLSPYFGVIVLRSNLEKKKYLASVVYGDYKKRWRIETHYNFVENLMRFYGLKTDDYYSMQGLSFIVLVVGQIKAAFNKRQKSSSSRYVAHLSTKECLIKTARIKISQHQNKKWYMPVTTKKTVELMNEMGVDLAADLKKLTFISASRYNRGLNRIT